MSRLLIKRGVWHELGKAKLGAPAYKIGPPDCFWNRKLADDHPVVSDGNNYAAKIARQARYSPSTTPAGYFPPPYNCSINRGSFGVPMWVVPAGYLTRKVYMARGENQRGQGNFVSGSTNISVTSTGWANGDQIVCTSLQEGTTVVSGGGTTSLVVSHAAIATSSSTNMFTVMPDSFALNLQAAWDAVPLPQAADFPVGHSAQLNSDGTDQELCVYQPSTDTMWEFWQWAGSEQSGYMSSYGAKITNVSQTPGTIPNTWGAKACSLWAVGGIMMIQEWNDGVIPHALNVALPVTAPSHLAPATRNDSGAFIPSQAFTDAVPEGAIFRLPASTVIDPAWTPGLKIIVTAVRDYGMVVTDTSGTVQWQAEDPRCAGTMFSPATSGTMANCTYLDMQTFPWDQLVQVAFP